MHASSVSCAIAKAAKKQKPASRTLLDDLISLIERAAKERNFDVVEKLSAVARTLGE